MSSLQTHLPCSLQVKKAGTLWPGFALSLLQVSHLGQHTQSVILKVTLAFGCLLLCEQERVLGNSLTVSCNLAQDGTKSGASCDLEYAVLQCPLTNGKSFTLAQGTLTELEQEQ